MNKKLTGFFFLCGILLVLFIAYVKPAKADDIVLNWTKATETESCTNAGPYTNAAGTKIWQLVGDINDPDIETFTLPNMVPGDYEFVATSYDENGVGSRISGATTKTVTTFTAPAGATAYQAVTISTGFWMIPMATVDVDTECDPAVNVNGVYYRIPNDSYTWNTGTTARPVMLVAECG